MRAPRTSHHRAGAALLIVLAALVLTTSVLSTLVSTAHQSHAASNDAIDAALSSDLLRQADAMSVEWLTNSSASVVLPPESPSPRVHVEGFELVLADTPVRLTLTAFDQHGLVSLAGAPSAVRSTLPADIQGVLSSMAIGALPEPFGLDQVPNLVRTDAQRLTYPNPASQSSSGESLAIGELIATHSGTSRATINPNTAPIPLVAAALREASLGGLESIIEARSNGRPVPMGSLVVVGDHDERRSIDFVSSSPCWAIRTDLVIGSHQQSWWTIWEGRGSRWTLAQRLRVSG